jgi:hypothetical protein
MERFERHQKLIGKCGFDRALSELAAPQIVVVLSVASGLGVNEPVGFCWRVSAFLSGVCLRRNMSEVGQKRKYSRLRRMSALPSWADIVS